MRNKIIFSLLSLFVLFFAGAALTMLYLYKTTSNLQAVINLHRVEIIRQDLVINAQTVQSHLYSFGTAFGQEVDVIADNVLELDKSARRCLECHHSKHITERLEEVVGLVEQYQDALSYLITTSANKERIERLRMVAIGIGTTLLDKVQEMAVIAGQKLNEKSVSSLKEINNSRIILIGTLILSFFIAIAIAVSMTKQVTAPIYELVDATRHLKTGEFGYTTNFRGTGEFKELIDSFNEMSRSLDDSNKKIMRHLHSLSNLYSVTLTFHSITNVSDIYRELAFGAAELSGVEQCGLLLKQDEHFVHMYPSVGVDPDGARLFKVAREAVLDAYLTSNRRAFILNDEIYKSPFSEADKKLNVKNMMLVWIRRKGELIGAIRLANKRAGAFTEEDVSPLAILANNVSVALENAKLYENLMRQMQEIKDAQQQLVDAAKFVAIGELASNVAHEINNPLTSVLGYAELIKEEHDITNIHRDIDVIERETLRARDIVRQLLEFARKRPLAIKSININDLLSDVIDLTVIQIRDADIRIERDFGTVAIINGDENQLKQVFINLINNAVFAMKGSGVLGIATYMKEDVVNIRISDTGEGIPKENLSRIYEPFFSTKKEKGTGIGLSVTYKIIQSHKGRIDVESEIGKGTSFTVSLPVHAPIDRPKTEESVI